MFRARFNVRFFAILCFFAIAIGAGFFFLHWYQVGRQAQSSLNQARQYFEQADTIAEPVERWEVISKGARSYRKYLKSYPDNVDVLFEEAECLTNQGKWVWKNGELADAGKLFAMGRAIFEQALRQDGNRADIREAFIDVLFEFGVYSTAIQHIRFFCDFPEGKEELRELFDDNKLWDRAVAAQKVKVGVDDQYDLSPLLKKDGRTVDRNKLLEFLGDDFWIILEDSRLLDKLGRCRLLLNNPKPAIKSLEKSVKLASDNVKAYDFLTQALRKEGRKEEAKRWVAEVVKLNPDEPLAYLIRGKNRLDRVRTADREEAGKVLINAEWDALQAVQKAIQRLLESAEKTIPDAEVTKIWSQDFKTVVNLSPVNGKAITGAYYDALYKVVLDLGPAVKLMETILSEQEIAGSQSSGTKYGTSLETLIEDDLTSCRSGLLLVVGCKLQESRLDPESLKTQLGVARKFAKAVLSLFPEDHNVYSILADIEHKSRNPQKMIDWMKLGAQNAKENRALLWRLGAALIHTGKVEEAREVLKQLKAADAQKRIILHLEALLDIRNKNWSSAVTKLEEVRPSFISSPSEVRKIDMHLADCYGHLGRLKDQREAFAHAVRYSPTWMPAMVGLAKSRAATGQLDKAIQDYKVIFRFPDVAPQKRLEYARLLLRAAMAKPKDERDFKSVEEAIDQAAIAVPNSLAIPLLRADLLEAKGEIAKARVLLTSLHENMDKDKARLLKKRNELLNEAKSLSAEARAARLDEAKSLLEQVRNHDLQKPQIWTKIILLASRQGDQQAANEAFQQVEDTLGDSPSLRWLRAQKLVQSSGKDIGDIATALHPLAENTGNFDRIQRLSLLRGLASIAVQLNDFPQAEKLAEEVLSAEPGDVLMQKVLFRVAKSKKDFEMMQSVLGRIRKSEGSAGVFWHYGEGVRLYMFAQEKKDPELIQDAIELLSTASRMEPRWHEPALFLGQIFVSQGKLGQASDLYLGAIRNGIQNPAIIQKVAGLLMIQRRYKEADEMFDLLTRIRGDNTSGADLSASYVKAQLGDFNQALRMARQVCEDSKNYQDFLWLSRVLEVSAKRARDENRDEASQKLYREAEQTFRKAIELDSEAVGAWIGLVHFYGLFGEKEKALEIINQAKDAIPKEEVDLALSQAYETLGEVKKAAIHYRKAIRSAPKDANVARMATLFFLKNNFPDESKRLLKRVVNQEVDANPAQIAWAKRVLSVLMLGENGNLDYTQAIALIDENLKVNPNSVMDLYTKASLLADDPTGLRWDEAITLLEQIKSQSRNPGVMVQLKLADLYYLVGRWGDYRELMQDVLSQTGDQFQIVSKHVLRLSEHGEHGETNLWLGRLKQTDSNNPKTFLIECEVAFLQERYDDLLKLLNDRVEKTAGKTDGELLRQLRMVVPVCQKYALRLRDDDKKAISEKFETQAEKLTHKLVDRDPRAEVGLVVLYSQQRQYEKAVAVLRKFADKTKPDEFGKIVYKTLVEGDPPESQIVEIQKLLVRILDAHPDAIFVKMMLAFCEEKLGHFDRAEAILRQAIREYPNNVDLMNYLAVMLALHEKDLEEARELIEETIKIAGPKPDLLDSRAMILLVQGRSKEAMSDLQKAIIKKPAPSFYFHLAEALQQQGQKKQAKKVLEKAHRSGFRETGLSSGERRHYQQLKQALQ